MGGGEDIIEFDIELVISMDALSTLVVPKLFNKEGALALLGGLTPWTASINDWMMQDYEAKLWSFKYWIYLSMVDTSKTSLFNFRQK